MSQYCTLSLLGNIQLQKEFSFDISLKIFFLKTVDPDRWCKTLHRSVNSSVKSSFIKLK